MSGLVIVGGGPAAAQAARSYREAGGTGTVTLLSGDDRPPYERPPLSKEFLRGEVEDATPIEDESFYAEHRVDLRLDQWVSELDLGERRVACGTSVYDFDVCVLATGSRPKSLPVPGGDDHSVHVLRLAKHALALRTAAADASRAVVCGSGFIGCEAAASLAMRGLEVVMVSPEELPLIDRLDRAAAERVASWLRGYGVRLVTGTEVTGLRDGRVELSDGTEHRADLVLAAVGVQPLVELAEQAGLAVRDGRVVTDEHMRTSDSAVYAAGDVALAYNASAGRSLAVEHWGDALAMGEVAGRNAAGEDASWSDPPGFWSTIGEQTLKYSAWGDGHDESRLVDHGDGFTVWYGRDGRTVGVLAHNADADYDQGTRYVRAGTPLSR